MKNTKTKIILSAIIFLSVAGFVGTAVAADPSLYVSPASLTKTAGDNFSVSMGFTASGSKICAAEGTLVFNNLSCQSITLAGDVNPQFSPTCSNPYFLIGVPSCATTDKVLFTVLVKAGSAGAASINFTGVDIIGEGVSVGSTSIGGNYTINAVPKSTPASEPKSTSAPTSAPTLTTPKTPTTPTAPVAEPVEESVVQTEQETPVVQEQTTIPQPIASQSLLAAISSAVTLGTGSAIVGILATIIIFTLVGYAIYAIIQRARRKNLGKLR